MERFNSKVKGANDPSEPFFDQETDCIFACGTNIYITSGDRSGTAVFYYDNGTRRYINDSGANGDDLRYVEIFAGSNAPFVWYENDITITISGGSVYTIYGSGSARGASTGTVYLNVINKDASFQCFFEDYDDLNGAFCESFNVVSCVTPSGGLDQCTAAGSLIYDSSKKTWTTTGDVTISDMYVDLASTDTLNVPAGTSISFVGNSSEIYNTGAKITGTGTVDGSNVTCYTHSYLKDLEQDANGGKTHTAVCFFEGSGHSSDRASIGDCTYDSNGICTVCGGYQPPTWANPYYKITNYGNLLWYSKWGEGEDMKLVNDISIGTSANPYIDWEPIPIDGATFDGNNHTISMYFKDSTYTGTMVKNTGLFTGTGFTVKNLVLKGNINWNAPGQIGAVASEATESTFQNIVSHVSITNQRSGYTGGIVGKLIAVNSDVAKIERCAVYADLSCNTSNNTVGGIVGYIYHKWQISDCVYFGTLTGETNFTGAIIGYDSTSSDYTNYSFKNCYYPDSYKAAGSTYHRSDVTGTAMTEAQLKDGSVTWLLNGKDTTNANTNVTWHQKIGSEFPLQTESSAFVYVVASLDGDNAKNLYTNDSNYIKKGSDGYYTIDSKTQMNMFRDFVNLGNTKANGRLMADIDFPEDKSEPWTPICSTGLYPKTTTYSDIGYQGTFDGNGYCINRLYVKGSSGAEASYGLFGTLSGTVTHLGLTNFTFALNGASDIRVGSIAGQILSGGKISNCYADTVRISTVGDTVGVAGGLAGCSYSGRIEYSHVFDALWYCASGRGGHIVGDNRGDGGAGDRPGSVFHCYYLADDINDSTGTYTGYITACEGVTTAPFKSGEICWKLNKNSSDGLWKQVIGQSLYPSFTGATVYKEGNAYFDDAEPDQQGGRYQIYNYGDMLGFTRLVNEGTEPYANAEMKANIDMSAFPSWHIGTADNPYTGTFQAFPYTLTVAIDATTYDDGLHYAAPFRYVGNRAKIQNLTLKGTITTGTGSNSKFAGSIVGSVVAGSTVTIDECYSEVTINSQIDGDGSHGGLIGIVQDNATANITNSAFRGTITGANTQSCGGMIGWVSNSKNNAGSANITNSYVAGTFSINTASGSSNTFCRSGTGSTITYSNCFYETPFQNTPSSGVTQATADQFHSGEIAWLLNGKNGGTNWLQDLSNSNSYPTSNISTSYKVYKTEPCIGYNNKGTTTRNHDYGTKGVCANCGAYEPYTGGGSKANPYVIKNQGNLMYFAQQANSLVSQGNSFSSCVVLAADLDMSGFEYIPVAQTTMGNSVSVGFNGTFDGQGHVVSNITIPTPSSKCTNGLFGTVVNGGTVRRVGVDNLTFYSNNGTDNRAAGIAGQLMSGATIEFCYVTNSSIQDPSHVVGGIAAMNLGTIRSCYTYGLTLAAHASRYGGICGDFSNGTVEHCYTTYKEIGSTATSVGTIKNCESYVSADRFKSGEITIKLNECVYGSTSGTQTDKTKPRVWRQNVDTAPASSLPTFSGGLVYQAKGSTAYTNDESAAHCFEQDGICSNWVEDTATMDGMKKMKRCNHYQACEGAGTAESPYQIDNPGKMLWFAEIVNNGYDGIPINTAACGELTANVSLASGAFEVDSLLYQGNYVDPRAFRIGASSETPYTGTFNGNFNELELDLTGNLYVAPFAYVGDGAVIKNLHTTGTTSSSKLSNTDNGKFASGMIGFVNSGTATLESCLSDVVINSTVTGDLTYGGLAGNVGGKCTLNINNCAFRGSINASNGNCCGGFVGWLEGTANISNSYVAGAFNIVHADIGNDKETSKMFCRTNNGTVNVTNSYYLDTLIDTLNVAQGGTAKTADQFKSGEVTWLLNGKKAADAVWKQKLGTDAYPNHTGPLVGFDGDGYYNLADEGTISATIEFNDMTFTYQRSETWDTATHENVKYAGEWSGTENAYVSVSNRSSSAICTTVEYNANPSYPGVTAVFEKSATCLNAMGTEIFDFKPAGQPQIDEVSTQTVQAGTITVNLTSNYLDLTDTDQVDYTNKIFGYLQTYNTKDLPLLVSATNITPDMVTAIADGVKNASKTDVNLTILNSSGKDMTVESKAFSKQTNFASVFLPNVTTIEMLGFSGCSLSSVNLPAVTSLGTRAFYFCQSLTSASLPKLLIKTVSEAADCFYLCSELTTVDIPSTKYIANNMFYTCLKLETVNAPSATNIGQSAFNNCISLRYADMPNVTSISSNAFYGCSELTSVNFPKLQNVSPNVFTHCQALEKVVFPKVGQVGASAFSDCISLKTVKISNANTIAASAFSGCTSLEKVAFGSMWIVYGSAFENCTNLKQLSFGIVLKSCDTTWLSGVETSNITLKLNAQQKDSATLPAVFGKNGTFNDSTFKEIKEYE